MSAVGFVAGPAAEASVRTTPPAHTGKEIRQRRFHEVGVLSRRMNDLHPRPIARGAIANHERHSTSRNLAQAWLDFNEESGHSTTIAGTIAYDETVRDTPQSLPFVLPIDFQRGG